MDDHIDSEICVGVYMLATKLTLMELRRRCVDFFCKYEASPATLRLLTESDWRKMVSFSRIHGFLWKNLLAWLTMDPDHEMDLHDIISAAGINCANLRSYMMGEDVCIRFIIFGRTYKIQELIQLSAVCFSEQDVCTDLDRLQPDE
jgi:hypothetical protein